MLSIEMPDVVRESLRDLQWDVVCPASRKTAVAGKFASVTLRLVCMLP